MYSGLKVPVNGAVPAAMEVVAESSKTVLTKFCPSAAHAREQRDRRPVRRHQDRGEAGIRRGRDAERDGDVGDRERAARVDGQRRVERAGAGRGRGGDRLVDELEA